MKTIFLCMVSLALLAGCKTPAPAQMPAVLPPPLDMATAAPAPPVAADPPPDTDVFVADLDLAAGKVSRPRNITMREGYDNQPAFLADDRALLFVSDRTGSTDIYRYELGTRATTQVTNTTEGEFSPTPLADGSGFSVIRVATPGASGADSTNPPLWRYGFDGRPIGKMLDVLSIGYHAWLDSGHVALFVVGDEQKQQPHTLVLAELATGKTVLLSQAPGRQLGRTPDGARVSFVDKSDPKRWVVAAMAPGDARPQVLVNTPEGPVDEQDGDRSEDYCWLPDGSLLMAKGGRFLRWNGSPGSGLVPFADLGDVGGDIKRMAVSHDGRHLAFVVQLREKGR